MVFLIMLDILVLSSSNVLTVFTVYVVVYLMTILALFGLERIGDRLITPMGTIQMLLGGLGLLQTVPLFSTLGVERGWWESFKEIIQVFATGGVSICSNSSYIALFGSVLTLSFNCHTKATPFYVSHPD